MCVCVILPVPPFLECPRLSRLPPSLGSASRARCLPPETQKKAARPPFPGSLPGSSALPAGEPRAKGPGPAASRPSPANSSRGRPGSAERPRERRRGPLRPPPLPREGERERGVRVLGQNRSQTPTNLTGGEGAKAFLSGNILGQTREITAKYKEQITLF